MGRGCGCCKTLNNYNIFVKFVPYVATSYSVPFPPPPSGDGCNDLEYINKYFYDLSLTGCGGAPPLPAIQDSINIPSCVSEVKKNTLKRNYDSNKLYISPLIEDFNLYINDNLELSDEFSYLLPRQVTYNEYNPGGEKYNYWRGNAINYIYNYDLGVINPEDKKLSTSTQINGYKGFNYTPLSTLCTVLLGKVRYISNRDCLIKADADFYNSSDVYTQYGFVPCGDGAILKGSYIIDEGIVYDINEYISKIEVPSTSYQSVTITYPIIITYSGNKANVTGSNSGSATYKTTLSFTSVNSASTNIQPQVEYVRDSFRIIGNTEVSSNASESYENCATTERFKKYPFNPVNPCGLPIIKDQYICGRHIENSGPKRLVISMAPKFTFGSAFVRLKYINNGEFAVKFIDLPIISLSSSYASIYSSARIEAYALLKGSISKNGEYIYTNNFQITICEDNADVTSEDGEVLIEYSGYERPVITDSLQAIPNGIGANAAITSYNCGVDFKVDKVPAKTIGIYYAYSPFALSNLGVPFLGGFISKIVNDPCEEPQPNVSDPPLFTQWNTRFAYETRYEFGEGAGTPINSRPVGAEINIDGKIFPVDGLTDALYLYFRDFNYDLIYINQEIN